MPKVWLLDYGAGNVRSIRNALAQLGFEVEDIERPEQIATAGVLLFPGVGSFGACMQQLHSKGWVEPLKSYLRAGRPFLGICLGMQTLFESSDESPGVAGLGIVPGNVGRFECAPLSVPQIGWNGLRALQQTSLVSPVGAGDAVYFVHSFRVARSKALHNWALCESTYGETYISGIARAGVCAVQFHPEKSGALGLRMLGSFFEHALATRPSKPPAGYRRNSSGYCKRVIACLDVRANDAGDLVVTKGDQYDVREKESGGVRNLGKPVSLARRYYEEGADEITFLNITAFRDSPLDDLPMLHVLSEASRHIFVPLTVGGGIRDMTDCNGVTSTALQVADAYFRAGADKVSIGSDAVEAARQWLEVGADGSSSIEQIAHVYGRQAVVISIDPRRVWVTDKQSAAGHPLADHTARNARGARGPNGESLCWYECTVQGGRKGSGLDVVQVTRACEALGAGEILLNCIDSDGQQAGFEHPLLCMVKAAVSIPVIASSGAGKAAHFSECFGATGAEAALAASIFHRHQVEIDHVKAECHAKGFAVRARAGAKPKGAGSQRFVWAAVAIAAGVLVAFELSKRARA